MARFRAMQVVRKAKTELLQRQQHGWYEKLMKQLEEGDERSYLFQLFDEFIYLLNHIDLEGDRYSNNISDFICERTKNNYPIFNTGIPFFNLSVMNCSNN